MKIFLIAGKARSGKSSVAESIKKYYDDKNEKTVITEFSKYVKLYAKEMTSWDGEVETKPRKFLQDMGYYIRHKLDMPELFINRMKEDILVYEKFYQNVVIADVRLPLEIEKMKENFPNVYTFYIINEHGNYDLTIEEAAHETETSLDHYNKFDYMIANDESELLDEKIASILEEVEDENN